MKRLLILGSVVLTAVVILTTAYLLPPILTSADPDPTGTATTTQTVPPAATQTATATATTPPAPSATATATTPPTNTATATATATRTQTATPVPPTNTATATATRTNTTTATLTATAVITGFVPSWAGLDPKCPSTDKVLADHDLTGKIITVTQPLVSWEPCLTVVELKPEFQGMSIPLLNGYQYTAALVNDEVSTFWGGDPKVVTVTLQWGTSIRWMPAYINSQNGKWAADPCELVVREDRFGRYRRNTDSGQPDVPYYGRVGPYSTLPGNVYCPTWQPPALDEIVPRTYLEATAMLGGRAVESEWSHSADFLTWKWASKGTGVNPWQSTYIPQASLGYIEIWLPKGALGPGRTTVNADGFYKFRATDLSTLLDGLHNVNSFTYSASK